MKNSVHPISKKGHVWMPVCVDPKEEEYDSTAIGDPLV
jgi:hypothetical protein